MDVNAMIRELRRILSPPPGSLKEKDPFRPITQALEYIFIRDTGITWLGLYLVSRDRKELVLGPFLGPVRVEVRLPLSSIPNKPGVWSQDSVLGYNTKRNDQWLGCIVGQTNSYAPGLELVRLVEVLGSLVTPWVVDCDREDPFS